MLVVKGLY